MKKLKEDIKLNIIPCIMAIISIIIAFETEKIIRDILILIIVFLLGIHVQRCIEELKKFKRGE